ncbi:MAG: hypothetical protein IBX45_09485 [Campylobacterales bacterium]|nr:hypothetical protein [Campylobacterales bacterium]
MPIFIRLLLLAQIACANVLFLGSKGQSFECDGVVGKVVSLQKCTDVKALDMLTICYFQNSDLGCRKLFKNESIALGAFEEDYGILEKIFSFDSNTKISMGIKRFSRENGSDMISMPYGTILKPATSLNILVLEDTISRVELCKKNGACIFKKEYKPNSQVSIGSENFQHGEAYSLTIKTEKSTHQSHFDILDLESANDVKHSIKSLQQSTDEKETMSLITAIIYEQYGLIYDKYKILGVVSENSK